MQSQFTVDGIEYTYSHMTTKTSLHLQLRLGKVIGPAMRSFFVGDPDMSDQAMGVSAVAELLQNLDEATLDAVILAFGKQCEFKDHTGTYRLDKAWESHFEGRHLELFSWLGECASAEWGSFIKGLAKLMSAPVQAPAQSV